jgi:Flp pilus assembly protein TadD
MKKITLSFTTCLLLSACATSGKKETPTPLGSQIDKPIVAVRATTEKSPNLLAIKDPLIEGVEARARGDYLNAYNKFYFAWLAEPKNKSVVLALSEMALKTGHAEISNRAISRLEIDAATAAPELFAAKVLTDISLGQISDSERRLELALQRAPNDPRLWNALGKYHDSMSNWEKAKDCYIQAMETGGSQAATYNNLGMSLLMQGQTRAAVSEFEKAIANDPTIDLYANNRRLALALNGQFLEAIKELPNERASDILNDAGYIAKMRDANNLAERLFSAAISRSDRYHMKAHENLEKLVSRKNQI